MEVRRATAGDTAEILRMREVMFAATGGRRAAPGAWRESARAMLDRRLAEPEGGLAAFVVAKPDVPSELASCVVGTIDCRLGGPDNPRGEIGYVFNVATDPGYRRRGYSRACLRELLHWYQQRGVTTVDLRATPQAEPLYREFGFRPVSSVTMRRQAR